MPNDDFTVYALMLGAVFILLGVVFEEFAGSPKVIFGFSIAGFILLIVGVGLLIGAFVKSMQSS